MFDGGGKYVDRHVDVRAGQTIPLILIEIEADIVSAGQTRC